MGVTHFGGAPHGLTLTDAGAPSGGAGIAVPVGYPQELAIESIPGATIKGSWDSSVWIELGTVGASGVLRLGRVRYRYLWGSQDWEGHQVDAGNIIGGDVEDAEGFATVLVAPDAGALKQELLDWLADNGVTGVDSLTKPELWNLINDLIDN